MSALHPNARSYQLRHLPGYSAAIPPPITPCWAVFCQLLPVASLAGIGYNVYDRLSGNKEASVGEITYRGGKLLPDPDRYKSVRHAEL